MDESHFDGCSSRKRGSLDDLLAREYQIFLGYSKEVIYVNSRRQHFAMKCAAHGEGTKR